MSKRPPTAKADLQPTLPEPAAIVRFYPDPTDIIREYVESDFAAALATEHERQVAVIVAEGAEVTDPISYQVVSARLLDVAAHRKAVEAWFKPVRDYAHRLHALICERERQILSPLVRFEQAAKRNILEQQRQEERRRREEEQRLAEQLRREEQERLARDAEHLERTGEPELAHQVLEEAVHRPAPVVSLPSQLATPRGISSRDNWKWRPAGGDTPEAWARAVLNVPREFLCLDEKKLNAYAKAHGASAKVAGIQFYNEGTLAVRT